jgi:hypothetical protein
MASEKYTTLGQSTLSSGYTSGATTALLTSGSSFPSEGNFRFRIDDEIFLVTARSSGTCTVVGAQEGTSASNHSSGATVTEVVTALSVDAIRSDQNLVGLYSALPSDAHKGDRYRSTDGYYEWYFNGTIWEPWYQGVNVTPPDAGDFVWFNQGDATDTPSTEGPILVNVPVNAGNNIRAYLVPVGSTFRVESLITNVRALGQYTACGLGLYDSASGNWVGILKNFNGANYLAQTFATALTSGFSQANPTIDMQQMMWQAIELNSGTLTYFQSQDGRTWSAVLSQSATARLANTPTHCGLIIGADQNHCANLATIIHFKVT